MSTDRPIPLALPLALLACCASPDSPECRIDSTAPAALRAVQIPAPMTLEGKAYDSAAKVTLPSQAPEEYEGLHNVYRLSEHVVSGSEPGGLRALERIRDMGVRTIVSVDGKAPDVAEAQRLGLRYVHVPIQYKGITGDELARLAKTFRELEGPFYVHCFHGKHRGPAAAAVGRVVLDGVSRETAISEMRQYCGTSPKYEGLYRVIATGHIPSQEETEAYTFGFEPVHRLEGVAGLMVQISRASDHVEELMALDWAVDSDHPDVDPLNEATKLAQAFEAACELGEVQMSATSDYRDWFASSRDESRRLVDSLARFRAGESAAGGEASASFDALKQTCGACHAVYRN